MSKEPTDDMIAKQDREGNDAPYKIEFDLLDPTNPTWATWRAEKLISLYKYIRFWGC